MSDEEKRILESWKNNDIFGKSVKHREKNKTFVFFEGPPTANGKPGVHHIESRAFKDAVLRYKTMRGFRVPRVAGWDTHGLPVEVEVEKELGLKSKKDIEKYGVAAFNKKCRESVWKYKELWEQMTDRMGFWIDMEHPYITYENTYIEKLWGVIKEFHKKKLLYEDYKVLPWCARCGTAVSSHELAQGYQKVTDKSVYVKFKISNSSPKPPPLTLRGGGDERKTPTIFYFLAWTTTPWTLPGNVALAIGKDIVYAIFKPPLNVRGGEGELYIAAKERVSEIAPDAKIIKELKGSDFVGMKYEPLFNIPALKNEHSHKVYAVDFVTTGEGTGIVHTAVMYGEDDYRLGEAIGLPKHHTVDAEGKFAEDLKPFGLEGASVKGQGVDEKIFEYLKANNLFFSFSNYEHDYPFCWRCKSPIIYYARKAWWVDVNKIRKQLLKNNESINWFPEFIKHGRFGAWLKEEKNWAFSRERFWGTPLPVWRCAECEKVEVIGSIEELQKKSRARNSILFMRHGEADHNVRNLAGVWLFDSEKFTSHLTDRGRAEVEKTSTSFKNIDVIIHSPITRSKETAAILKKYFASATLEQNSDITEINLEEESALEVKKRMESAVRKINERFSNKNIVIISHGDPLWIFGGKGKKYPETGKLHDIAWCPEPRDGEGNLDLHKPYIDAIALSCRCGSMMTRVPEVVDVWFDSGAMPFASDVPGYPADIIAEAIDQTRGWFYSLLAVATLLGKKAPYKNVISLGHLLDEKGKKMSKSLGNIVDPMMLLEKYGADAVRWYFYTINQPWDSKLFKEEDVKDAQRRFFMILENVLSFLKMYRVPRIAYSVQPKLIINKWILTRLNEVVKIVAEKLDVYDIVGAARDIEYFVAEDVSRWYVRRIRSVMKPAESSPNNQAGKHETESVLRHVLLETAKLLAPFAPFAAEHIYRELGGEKESVHMEDYPRGEGQGTSEKLLEDMKKAREIVSRALEVRASAGIRVRQPLAALKIRNPKSQPSPDGYGRVGEIRNNVEIQNLIKEETNTKEIIFDETIKNEIELALELTLELKEEGMFRDITREIQSARKKAGLKPGEQVAATISAPQEMLNVIKKYEEEIKKETSVSKVETTTGDKIKISF